MLKFLTDEGIAKLVGVGRRAKPGELREPYLSLYYLAAELQMARKLCGGPLPIVLKTFIDDPCECEKGNPLACPSCIAQRYRTQIGL